jgi:hypothetical protein
MTAESALSRRVSALWAIGVLIVGLAGCATRPPDDGTENLPIDDDTAGLKRGGWQDRYFSYGGEFEYFVGFDLQQLHADTGIDYREKLDFLAAHDVNKVRIWLYPSFFGLPGDRNYPANGRILYPWRVDANANKFDLDQWDPEFWSRTRQFLAYARQKGIIVEISLFSIQEPRNYFRQRDVSYAFHHRDNLQDFGRPTDRNGAFMRGFFALGYADNGRTLHNFHAAYIDKALIEFGDFDNIYYELMNEAPGERYWIRQELPHSWLKYWLRYIAEKTEQPVTTHSTGFMDLRDNNRKGWTRAQFAAVGRRYWSDDHVDGFNFHFYSSDPAAISMALNVFQRSGLMLICNEGDGFYDLDRSAGYPNYRITLDVDRLYGEIRHAWGMMTAGGYYSIYFGPVPLVGDATSTAAAEAMQAMRQIVEMTRFEALRPVRDDGSELDDLVSTGPGSGWQVIADPGVGYLAYFWGDEQENAATITLPAGHYRYAWMDPRSPGPALAVGDVALEAPGAVRIGAPQAGRWDSRAGLVLVITANPQ